MKLKLRPLNERDCYSHCYGVRDGNVRIVKVEPRRPRYAPTVSGEEVRLLFEARMGSRPEQ